MIRTRSWLFTLETRPERFAKASLAGADVAILALGDTVAPRDKVRARTAALDYLADNPSDDALYEVSGGQCCILSRLSGSPNSTIPARSPSLQSAWWAGNRSPLCIGATAVRSVLVLGLLIAVSASAQAATKHHHYTRFEAVPGWAEPHRPSIHYDDVPSYNDPSKYGGGPALPAQ